MLKQHNQLMLALFVVADALAITGAWLLSYWLRFSHLPVDPAKGVPPLSAYLVLLPVVVAVHLITFWRVGLYAPRRVNALWVEARDVMKAFVVVIVAVIVIDYFQPQAHKTSRGFLLTYALIGAVGFLLFRISARLLLRLLRSRGYNQRIAAVLGSGRNAQRLMQALHRNTWTGLRVAYFVDDRPAAKPGALRGVPVYGPLTDVGRLLTRYPVDAVFVALPAEQAHRTNELLAQLDQTALDVRIAPELDPLYAMRPTVSELEGVPILSLRQSPLEGWNAIAKRGFDVIVGVAATLVAAGPMLLIAVLIKLTSRGPVFYLQDRVGFDGRRFKLVKFRTMHVDAERRTGAVWARTNDDRRTSLGRFLRRTSLDELPNLFNVLAGHMSLVGPRPERPELIRTLSGQAPKYLLRHKIKAGMTGYAQVRGHRGQMATLRKRLQHDLYYIRHWSLALDVRILLQTVVGVWFSRHET